MPEQERPELGTSPNVEGNTFSLDRRPDFYENASVFVRLTTDVDVKYYTSNAEGFIVLTDVGRLKLGTIVARVIEQTGTYIGVCSSDGIYGWVLASAVNQENLMTREEANAAQATLEVPVSSAPSSGAPETTQVIPGRPRDRALNGVGDTGSSEALPVSGPPTGTTQQLSIADIVSAEAVAQTPAKSALGSELALGEDSIAETQEEAAFFKASANDSAVIFEDPVDVELDGETPDQITGSTRRKFVAISAIAIAVVAAAVAMKGDTLVVDGNANGTKTTALADAAEISDDVKTPDLVDPSPSQTDTPTVQEDDEATLQFVDTLLPPQPFTGNFKVARNPDGTYEFRCTECAVFTDEILEKTKHDDGSRTVKVRITANDKKYIGNFDFKLPEPGQEVEIGRPSFQPE